MLDPSPLDTLLDQCERIVAIHEHLRMDTEEDERVRIKDVEIARRALGQCRDYVERVRALGPRPDRAAALRDVETLLHRVTGRAEPLASAGWFFVLNEHDGFHDSMDPAELAREIVDRVLGAEQDGESAC